MNTADVAAAEDARAVAMIRQDIAALGRLLSEDLIWIHSSGQALGKSSFLARIAEGRDRYLAIKRSEVVLRLYGAIAIVTGIAEIEATVDGKPKSVRNRFTNIWYGEGEDLRVVSCQSTRV